MDIQPPLEADAQLAETGQPRMGTFDHPAMSARFLAAFDTATRNAGHDASTLEMLAATSAVIAFIGMQLVWPLPRSAWQTGNRRNGFDQCLECHRVMAIGAGDTPGQRYTASVDDDVSLAAQLATGGGVRAGFLAPRGAGNTCSVNTGPAPVNLVALTQLSQQHQCRRSQTPRACQSRRRRQQVMPLPKHSS